MFDLRALPGETWLVAIQIPLLAVGAITLLAAILLRRTKRKIDAFAWSYVGIATFLAVSVTSGLFIWGNPAERVFTGAVPLLILMGAIFLIENARASGLEFRRVFDLVLRAAAISIVARFILVFALRGIDFSVVRYEILCGATNLVTAYLLTRVVAGFSRFDLVLAGAQIATIVASVTRTVAFAAAGSALLLLTAVRRQIFRGRALGNILVAAGALAVVGIGILTFLPSNQTARWAQSLSRVSLDPYESDLSILARRAVVDYQFERLSDSNIGLLLGFGIAADEGLAGTYEALAEYRGSGKIELTRGFADNTYSSALYLGGVLGGAPLLAVLLLWGVSATRVVLVAGTRLARSQLYLLAAPLTVVANVLTLFLAGELGDRMWCLYFGYAIAMTFWIERDLIHSTVARYRWKSIAGPRTWPSYGRNALTDKQS